MLWSRNMDQWEHGHTWSKKLSGQPVDMSLLPGASTSTRLSSSEVPCQGNMIQHIYIYMLYTHWSLTYHICWPLYMYVYMYIYIYTCRHGTNLVSWFTIFLWYLEHDPHGSLKSVLTGHVRFCGNLCGKLDGTPGALSKGGATVEWHNVERFFIRFFSFRRFHWRLFWGCIHGLAWMEFLGILWYVCMHTSIYWGSKGVDHLSIICLPTV